MAKRRKIEGLDVFIGPTSKIPKPPKKSRSKFHNRITIVHGIKFHSMGEALRYEELFAAQKAGAIRNLQLQVPYALHAINGAVIAKYIADFVYEEKSATGDWVSVTEDFKGLLTDVYKIKKKWMLAEHGIAIRESFSKKSTRRKR